MKNWKIPLMMGKLPETWRRRKGIREVVPQPVKHLNINLSHLKLQLMLLILLAMFSGRISVNYPMMNPEDFHAVIDWPGVRPNLYGGGGSYGVADDVVAKAQGDNGDGSDEDEGVDLDDPERVHNANTTWSDDSDSGSD